jgi:uncharacterized membrane-anchored protein
MLFSSKLATALGDFLADSSGLGFSGGGFLIASLLGLGRSSQLSLPNPKSFAVLGSPRVDPILRNNNGDLLTKTDAQGGFGFGTINSS